MRLPAVASSVYKREGCKRAGWAGSSGLCCCPRCCPTQPAEATPGQGGHGTCVYMTGLCCACWAPWCVVCDVWCVSGVCVCGVACTAVWCGGRCVCGCVRQLPESCVHVKRWPLLLAARARSRARTSDPLTISPAIQGVFGLQVCVWCPPRGVPCR